MLNSSSDSTSNPPLKVKGGNGLTLRHAALGRMCPDIPQSCLPRALRPEAWPSPPFLGAPHRHASCLLFRWRGHHTIQLCFTFFGAWISLNSPTFVAPLSAPSTLQMRFSFPHTGPSLIGHYLPTCSLWTTHRPLPPLVLSTRRAVRTAWSVGDYRTDRRGSHLFWPRSEAVSQGVLM